MTKAAEVNSYDVPWEVHAYWAAARFVADCAVLDKSNPYQTPALNILLCDAFSELLEQGYSKEQIAAAVTEAAAALHNDEL
jgi:hypothetical protein